MDMKILNYMNWKILIKFSLKFVPEGRLLNNIPALVQVMA